MVVKVKDGDQSRGEVEDIKRIFLINFEVQIIATCLGTFSKLKEGIISAAEKLDSRVVNKLIESVQFCFRETIAVVIKFNNGGDIAFAQITQSQQVFF